MTRIEDLFALVLELRVQQGGGDERPSDAAVDASAALLGKGFRIAAGLMTVVGALIGFGTVAAVVRDAGAGPINLIGLIVVTMLLPLAMVLVTLLWMLLSGRGRQTTWGEAALVVLRFGVSIAAKALDHTAADTKWKTHAALGVARGDYRLLEPVLPWTALRLTQRFALALSAGFTVALLVRMIGTDLTFGWQTTIDGVADVLPTVVAILSLPFGWISEDLQVSDALIHATRFERFGHQFAGGPAAAQASGAWWPFLVVGSAFWGLVPRSAILLLVHRRERQAIAAVLRENAPLRAVQQRLRGLDDSLRALDVPGVGTPVFARPDGEAQPFAPEALARAAEQQPALRAQPAAQVEAPQLRAVALFWQHDTPPDDAFQARLEQSLGIKPELRALFGNRAAEDARILDDVGTRAPDIAVLYVEHFVAPNAGFVRALERVRHAIGPTAPILVVLAWFENGTAQPVPPRTLELWTQKLQSLGDPRIRLHAASAPLQDLT